MEKKTLSLNVGNTSGEQPLHRVARSRRRRRLTEVMVEQSTRRRVSSLSSPQRRKPIAAKPQDRAKPPPEKGDERQAEKLEAIQKHAELLKQEQAEAKKRQREEAKQKHIESAKETEEKEAKSESVQAAKQPEKSTLATADSLDIPPASPTAKSRAAPSKRLDKKQRREAEQKSPSGGRAQKERRRRTKIDVASALSDEVRQRSHAAYLRSQERKKRKSQETTTVREKVVREVQLPESIIVQELANRMAERVADVIKMLMNNGISVNQNQTIDADTAEVIISDFGHKVTRVSASDVEDVIETKEDSADDLEPRPAVISVMGHVDHGKTSLLDAIRKTNVAAGEAGGITQHIGAYQVRFDGGKTLTFLDTPGHAAFTEMRARGAHVTDIVVLVVAADDAVMPQTIEAINHAQAAGVPIIVAINKIDLPSGDADKVRNDLLRHDVIVEKRSGDVLDVEISALENNGIDTLLEAIALQAELLELTANPNRQALGAVIESRLDVGRGPVATILVQKGTLKKGDVFVVGDQWGRVRALVDDAGTQIDAAGPSVPAEVIGLNGTPMAGDILNVVENESQAKEISRYRLDKAKAKRLAAGAVVPIDQLMTLRNSEEAQQASNLQLVVKADVQGSVEAIVQAVEKIGNDEVNVRVLHSGVGAITETDISLAEASGAQVIGFNVRANAAARVVAAQKKVDIRYYSVIYALVDNIRSAASNLLSAEVKETFIGAAEILEIFKITGTGFVAGCKVTDGTVRRSAGVRLLRDNIVIHEGKLKTLKRFKDEVNEVVSGQECGMAFENYANIRKGDAIEVFEREEIQRSL